jgi:nicotinamidase-related amidase
MNVRGLEPGRKSALVISECQRGTTDPDYASLPGLADEVVRRGTLAHIARLARRYRELHLPVVHLPVAHRPGYEGVVVNCTLIANMRKLDAFVEGGADTEINPQVAPEPGDFVLWRWFGLTAWYPTPLDTVLRNSGVSTIVLTGVSTNIAVQTTAVEAIGRGYSVVVPEDATAGASPESHRFVVENLLPIVATVSSTDNVMAAVSPDPG